ncbi:hypothetical protein ABZ635_22145 [Nocardiopsis sp. NPDC007018]|uniref:hypothetical protein n=1 Tax=Nocardiopsis sp. NPDC007018 TaxID=3155721 RepID=UPI0033C99BF6
MSTPPDLLRAVRDWVDQHLEGVRVVTSLPKGDRLDAQLTEGPAVSLTRGVGGGYVKGERRVLIDVDVLSLDEEVMWETTDRTWQTLDAMTAQFVGGVLVDQMRVHNGPGQVGPGQVGHENPGVKRTFATYRLTTRS